MDAERHVLLVGEGNFSFAAALGQAGAGRLTATCPERRAHACGRTGAARSLQRLRAAGADVRFGVDCTKLREFFSPAERRFDRIYFNFPHCGKKSGVKKNRELLAKFFCSCAEVLTEKGEVHVVLCRGQGGTPADQPTREWHNSWQVVAMGAGGGFILSDVHPFEAEHIPGYECTGYRSQDKSFCVEGALNHIFTRSLPFPHPSRLICQIKLDSKCISFQVPEIFVDKINRGFLDINSGHPVRTINEKLMAELGQTFPLQRVDCSLPLLHQGLPTSFSHSDVFWIAPDAEQNPSSDPTGGGAARTLSFSGLNFSKDTDQNECVNVPQKGDQISQHYHLRPSLLADVQPVAQSLGFLPGTVYVLSGLVFRKCLISPHTLPVFHETLFICTVNKGSEGHYIQMLMDSIKNSLCSLLQSDTLVTLSLSEMEVGTYETAELNGFVTSECQHNKSQYFICVKTASYPSAKGSCVGTIAAAPSGLVNSDLGTVFASVNLDLLALQVCGIPDWRMLWTFDERFLNQFGKGELRPFRSFSLYPPSYVHDISFWVPERGQFDETAFHTVARRVSQETVVSIQLLDTFRHPQTGQTSLCYRLTFQSCDKALTHQQVAEMQMRFRKEIQQCLHVVLR